MIRSELNKTISLLTVALLLLHIVLQSAGLWSVQIVTSVESNNCCGAEVCCCEEADQNICSCSISDMPQTQKTSQVLWCGFRSNERENENNSADYLMQWMDIKALVHITQPIHQPELTLQLATITNLYKEIIPDLNSPPPIG